MTDPDERLAIRRSGVYRLAFTLALIAAVPALVVKTTDPQLSNVLTALLFGLAIVGAAFLLSWAAEVAQLDISAGLSLAVLALIAVLPEYAVDFVFAWKGGTSVRLFGPGCPGTDVGDESPCSLALANMTGANRLLIGVGWATVVFIAWARTRHKRATLPDGHERRPALWSGIRLERSHAVEVGYLAVATLYSLTLPLKHSVTLLDSAVLIGLFALYAVRISRAPAEEPHLVGPAQWLGAFPVRRRRVAVGALFAVAGAIIVLCAEPFAHALVETGKEYGISEFFLVQWLAPLASEAPEFIVAALFAWRLNTNSALGALVSSKVNQWTLLVGSLPIVFAVASGGLHGLPIAGIQREELLLTAAQSLFAVAILANLRMSLVEASWIFALFWAQFLTTAFAGEHLHDEVLLVTSAVYLGAAIVLLARNRHAMGHLLRDGFRTPYAQLVDTGDGGASGGSTGGVGVGS
jgi:cation:H+ antiporter